MMSEILTKSDKSVTLQVGQYFWHGGDDMTFGERLKKARIDSGINQADAAKKLEMSRPTLSAIEADKRQVLASEILQFA